MRKRICVSLMALSFLASMAAGATASAKLVKTAIGAQIPFDFHADDHLTRERRASPN